MQVALIAALCCDGPIWLVVVVVVVVVVACCCCILYGLVLILAPDLCTLCPDLCTLHPDLCTLCLWCFSSFNWCNHSTCTGGGCHQLQHALVVPFPAATSADI